MSANYYKWFLSLMPEAPEDVGEVVAIGSDGVSVETIAGAIITARGSGWSLGDLVYVRDGAVTGSAPEIEAVEIEV